MTVNFDFPNRNKTVTKHSLFEDGYSREIFVSLLEGGGGLFVAGTTLESRRETSFLSSSLK
jgi:hypothetical protein